MMGTVADNIKRIRERINEAAQKSNKEGNEIFLVAASKTKPPEMIREAIKAGVNAIGENRVQELHDKNAIGAYEGTSLHFIGHLQRNKINQIVGICDLIESVDSLELMETVAKRAVALGIVQEVLIEINIAKEVTKHGFYAEEAIEICHFASTVPGIYISGLMAVPPPLEHNKANIVHFEKMYGLFVDIRGKKYNNISMTYLSLGMSNDYYEAILSGSNMVRIGSAIFGNRLHK